MTRIAASLAGLALLVGVLCLPALAGAAEWDEVRGSSPTVTIVVLALGVALTLLLVGRAGRRRERSPRLVDADAPPEGLGPAQAVLLLGEPVTTRTLAGSLLHAAQRRAVSLERVGDAWTVTRTAGPPPALDAPTAAAVARLVEESGTVTLPPGDRAAGARVHGALCGLRRDLGAWGRTTGTFSRGGPGPYAALLLLVGAAGVLACLLLRPWHLALLGVLPGALVVGGVADARAGAGRRRTRRGRRAQAQVAGYRALLAAPSSRRRFGLDARPERWATELPWAVALGCTRSWTAKYRTETGAEPPVPDYLPAYSGEHTVAHVDAALHSLSTALDGALAAHVRPAEGRRLRTR